MEGFFDDRIYYRCNEFINERTTLLFIHGLSGSSSAWVPYEERFGARYNTLSVDLRGHGKSFKPLEFDDYSIEKVANDIRDLLAFLHIDGAIAISHSLGTLPAIQLVHDHQHLFSAAIFISPNYGIYGSTRASILRPFIAMVSAIAHIFPFSPRARGHIDYEKYRNTGDWNVRRMFSDISNTQLRPYLYSLNHVYLTDLDLLWQHIEIPTLVIHGSQDTMVPLRNARALVGEMPNAELSVIPDGDHVIVINDIDAVVERIEAFLKKLEKGLVTRALPVLDKSI
jgi:3-oxoadipate enol-lactonase